jgi:hypothetical protein
VYVGDVSEHTKDNIYKICAVSRDKALLNLSSEAFTAVMFQVEVFRVMAPHRLVAVYHRPRGSCCLHLEDEVK